MEDHRTVAGEDDPLDVYNTLLDNHESCREKLSNYVQKSTTDRINKTLAELKGDKGRAVLERENRPTCWADVKFVPVPLQEGEEPTKVIN